jgi:hypothetical protein
MWTRSENSPAAPATEVHSAEFSWRSY